MDYDNLLKSIKKAKLRQAVEQAEEFARVVWGHSEVPLLRGFTDHGIEHSERMIERLLEILGDTNPLVDTETAVLLCACWLHDIGMQDYGVAEEQWLLESGEHRPYELELEPAEIAATRADHANRVRFLHETNRPIRLRTKSIGGDSRALPDLEGLAQFVGHVCVGHSTSGFKELVSAPSAEWSQGPYGSDTSFQLVLLAALLLVCDECDLHRSRSAQRMGRILPGVASITAFHHLKHKWVSSSKIHEHESNDKKRVLHINYAWKIGRRKQHIRDAYKRCIEGKLFQQFNLVNSILEDTLHVSFHCEEPIRTSQTSGIFAEHMASEQSFAEPALLAESSSMDLTNYREALDRIRAHLHSGSFCVLVEANQGSQTSADQIMQTVAGELIIKNQCQRKRAFNIVHIHQGREADTIRESAKRLACKAPRSTRIKLQGLDVADLLQVISNEAHTWGPSLILVHHAHQLTSEMLEFVGSCLTNIAVEHPEELKLLVSLDSLPQLHLESSIRDAALIEILGPVEKADVASWLERKRLFDRNVIETAIQSNFANVETVTVQNAEDLARSLIS